jgi:antitoxin component of MazEF toxin-antitoxin module
MTELFKAKLRRVGNSTGIIIPNDILSKLGYSHGDVIHLAIPPTGIKNRNTRLLRLAGIDRDKPKFKRDKRDRY